MNYYEAWFIVALLDYINTIFEVKKNEKILSMGEDADIEDFTIGVIVPYRA